MRKLKADWVTEGLLDFEYKKYLLLAYLKWVSGNFDDRKLYPFLSDLIFHYRNLVSLRDKKVKASNSFPAKLSRLDLQQFRIEYEKIVEDPDFLDVISQILDFAIPKLKSELSKGKELYENVEHQLTIEPIGLVPMDKDCGYIFLYTSGRSEASIYNYRISIFEGGQEKYRGIQTTYLSDFSPSLSHTFESQKLNLIRHHKDLPNPATWLVSSKLNLPLDETLLPIAKRSLVRLLARKDQQGPLEG